MSRSGEGLAVVGLVVLVVLLVTIPALGDSLRGIVTWGVFGDTLSPILGTVANIIAIGGSSSYFSGGCGADLVRRLCTLSALKPTPRWLRTPAFGRCETTPGVRPARFGGLRMNEMKMTRFTAKKFRRIWRARGIRHSLHDTMNT